MKYNFTLYNHTLVPQWVTGMADSEGNFSLNHNSNGRVSVSFKVTQKQHSIGILYDLQRFFGCGTICIDNREEGGYKYIVQKRADLITKIIPHFDTYKLISSKYLDFMDLKQAVGLLGDKDNLSKILEIKARMNDSRPFDERWHNFAKLPSIQPD